MLSRGTFSRRLCRGSNQGPAEKGRVTQGTVVGGGRQAPAWRSWWGCSAGQGGGLGGEVGVSTLLEEGVNLTPPRVWAAGTPGTVVSQLLGVGMVSCSHWQKTMSQMGQLWGG